MTVTVGIKALNEAAHIESSIQSALDSVSALGGDVVLADSGSTDGTLEIAQRYPIRIVQLANLDERCCGAGAQLAFQSSTGKYFYILDGDMVLEAGFLEQAVAFLDAHPEHAGVGGRVREMNVANAEFAIRAAKLSERADWQPGDVERLDCGGLYRSEAVRGAGYFADRNLHAFEEFELAARLAANGWRLARIDVPAVRHYGHTTEGYRLLMRRVRSGYTSATGEVLRAAIGRRHFGVVMRRLGHIHKGVAVIAWWVALVLLPFLGVPGWAVVLYVALPFLWFWWRRRQIGLVPYSFLVWNATALGLITGLFRRRVSPEQPLAAVEYDR